MAVIFCILQKFVSMYYVFFEIFLFENPLNLSQKVLKERIMIIDRQKKGGGGGNGQKGNIGK
jgi:hypothetical protein